MTAGVEFATLRFGSLRGRLFSPAPEYTEEVALVFGAEVLPGGQGESGEPRFELTIEESSPAMEAEAALPPIPANGMRLGGTADRPTLATEVLRAELRLDVRPARIRVVVRQPGISRFELRVHIAVVLNKLLFLMDHVVLHAAAVRLNGSVNLFVGEKGAGKSTICLGLARAGGTVLGEDHVILRRTGEGFLVSGGDERSRVTERTERHFFTEPLDVAPKDFAGTPKKEIRLGDYFSSRPYEDFPAHRLLFPAVTGRFRVQPLRAQPALLRLMKYTAQFQRFAGGPDQARFLEILSGFIGTVSAYEVELSHDLDDLGRLAEVLRHA
ncbi:MAG TPA: hypothetical protein VF187_03945 [Gemmatimonadales bacterium]